MRNRYLDLLRAAAIIRVIVYHLFGWPWLSIVLPAMGIMFALAGSLTAQSLDKRAAGQVVLSRVRRLLPPLWLLGLIAVPAMLVAGWAHEDGGEHPFRPSHLLFWVLPLADPPGSDKGVAVWETLWYIRAYVWFALLSPVMYAVYRKIGWAAVALPLVIMAALDLTGVEFTGSADAEMWDFVTYGACWMLGFAHHDGRLRRVRPWLLVPVAVAMGAVALWYHAGNQGETPWDLNDVPESQALWSLAFVLLVLRWQPPMGWLARIRPLDSAVSVLNARAVTVYLWHNLAIAVVWPVLTVLALDDFGARLEGVTEFAVALALTFLAVVAFGWAEDLAARRRPALWPATTKKAEATEKARLPFDFEQAVRPGTGHAARRGNVASAMHRMPANWPPAPRTARDEHEPEDVAGHEPTVGELAAGDWPEQARQDPGLPIAGRPAEPLTPDEEPSDWFRQRR